MNIFLLLKISHEIPKANRTNDAHCRWGLHQIPLENLRREKINQEENHKSKIRRRKKNIWKNSLLIYFLPSLADAWGWRCCFYHCCQVKHLKRNIKNTHTKLFLPWICLYDWWFGQIIHINRSLRVKVSPSATLSFCMRILSQHGEKFSVRKHTKTHRKKNKIGSLKQCYPLNNNCFCYLQFSCLMICRWLRRKYSHWITYPHQHRSSSMRCLPGLIIVSQSTCLLLFLLVVLRISMPTKPNYLF